MEWVKSRPGFVLAGMEGIQYRKNELQLAQGDILYLYTDGVTEALNVQEELFGDRRLEETLSVPDIRNMKPENLLNRVSKTLRAYAGSAEQADDITMLALKRMRNQVTPDRPWHEIHVLASTESWQQVNDFLEKQMEILGCKMSVIMQVLIAAEEIFVNIASYAYENESGSATVRTSLDEEGVFHIQFEDSGMPYNPLDKQDPDITLCAEERNVGGLGIFMAKKNMDELDYVYLEGRNILTMRKNIER